MRISFHPGFLKKLEALAVVSKKAFSGRAKGERRSPRQGSSVEFKDFRSYVQGDDFRHVDWNAYARFESLFLKLFREEEDLHISLLLDRSRSMDFGGKFEMAVRVAAALGYIGLANLDRVSLWAFSTEGVDRLPWLHGRAQVHRLLEFLEGLRCSGSTDLSRRVRDRVEQSPRPGLAVLISDFLDPAGYETPLSLLRFHGYEVVAVQILSREEMEPRPGGDWRFQDCESGATVDLSLGPRAVRLYQARLRAFTAGLDAWCRAHDVVCLRAVADQDFADLVLKYFREADVVA